MGQVLRQQRCGIILNIYVQPGSKQDQLAGQYRDCLKIKLRAKAVDGAANKALCEFLADYLGIANSSVRIVRGASSRQKLVEILGDAGLLTKGLEQLLT